MSKLSLYPRLVVSVSTPGRCCIHALYKVLKKNANPGIRHRYSHAFPSLYPHLAVAISTLCISFFFFLNANPRNSDGASIPAMGRLGRVPHHAIYKCKNPRNTKVAIAGGSVALVYLLSTCTCNCIFIAHISVLLADKR